jgi:hypothetical protein
MRSVTHFLGAPVLAALAALTLTVSSPAFAKRQAAPSLGLDVDMPNDAESTLTDRFMVVTLKEQGILLYVHRIAPNDKEPLAYVEGIAKTMTPGGAIVPGALREGIAMQPIFMTVKGVPHRGLLAYLPRPEGGILVQALVHKSAYTPELDRLATAMITSTRLIPISSSSLSSSSPSTPTPMP